MNEETYIDEISELIEEAYAIFNNFSIYEVIHMNNRQSQEDFLNKIYNNPDPEAISRYLDVVNQLEMVVG